MLSKNIIGLSMAGVLMAGTAMAQTTATAVTDLNLRAGPGPNYVILDVIAEKDDATVDGCLADANWCKVTYNGTSGWAYGDYLSVTQSGEVIALYPNRETVEVSTVTYENDQQADAALTLGAMGAAAGALIVGGPLAIAAGAAAGMIGGAAIEPDTTVVTYVTENPVEPVFVNGEVVVGAGIPETVTLYPVPDADYQYVNLNGQYVFVRPEDRRIVYIQR
jgi:uncharacterized protein YraI